MNSTFQMRSVAVTSVSKLQEEKCVRNSSPDSHQHVPLTSNIIELTGSGFFSNSSNYDWLAAAIFGRGSYENLSVGNPQNRDNWISIKAVELGSKGKKLIDMSAGNKPYEDTFRKHGFEYYSSEFQGNIDVHDSFRGEQGEKELSDLHEKHDFVYSDIKNTTIPSEMFDVAVLTEVLEHLPEPLIAMKELGRVLKPGGHALVTSPFTSGSHQQPFHFSSGYPPEWYAYAARQSGLQVVEITSQGGFFSLMAQELERAWSCGSPPHEMHSELTQFFNSLQHAIKSFFLLKAEQNDASSVSCVDQFTIGWMVLLQKEWP